MIFKRVQEYYCDWKQHNRFIDRNNNIERTWTLLALMKKAQV